MQSSKKLISLLGRNRLLSVPKNIFLQESSKSTNFGSCKIGDRRRKTDSEVSKASDKMESQVHHDTDETRFILKPVEGAESAVLVYDRVANGVIDFHHTEVPAPFRGKGLAKILAKAGLDFAVREDLKVILSCSYMAKYVADNPRPEYMKLLYSKH